MNLINNTFLAPHICAVFPSGLCKIPCIKMLCNILLYYEVKGRCRISLAVIFCKMPLACCKKIAQRHLCIERSDQNVWPMSFKEKTELKQIYMKTWGGILYVIIALGRDTNTSVEKNNNSDCEWVFLAKQGGISCCNVAADWHLRFFNVQFLVFSSW